MAEPTSLKCAVSNTGPLLSVFQSEQVAKAHGLSIIGFPGLLIRACKAGQMTPENARDILLKCASLGTHYANHFIEAIYRRLKEEIP